MTSGRDALVALVNDPVQEGAGGQDHSPGTQFDAFSRHYADNTVAVQDQPLRRPGHQGQVGRLRQFGLHGLPVKPPVDLAARAPHGRPLGTVQEAELNPGLVAQSGHQTVHGIDLADQMALAQPADGRVAGHFSDGLEFLGQQNGASARARGRRRRLAARMTPADNNDIETLHGRAHRPKPSSSPPRPSGGFARNRLFADAEGREDLTQYVLNADGTGDPGQGLGSPAQIVAGHFR